MSSRPIGHASAWEPAGNRGRRISELPARLIGSLMLAVSLGCGADATSPGSKGSTDVDLGSDFPMTITGGTRPTVTFAGVRGGSLSFEDQDGGTVTGNDSWYFFGRNPDTGFGSPVTYGVLPAGAYCGLAAGTDYCPTGKPLVRGHRYLVILLTTEFKVAAHMYTP